MCRRGRAAGAGSCNSVCSARGHVDGAGGSTVAPAVGSSAGCGKRYAATGAEGGTAAGGDRCGSRRCDGNIHRAEHRVMAMPDHAE